MGPNSNNRHPYKRRGKESERGDGILDWGNTPTVQAKASLAGSCEKLGRTMKHTVRVLYFPPPGLQDNEV